jgi:hypothetical protein
MHSCTRLFAGLHSQRQFGRELPLERPRQRYLLRHAPQPRHRRVDAAGAQRGGVGGEDLPLQPGVVLPQRTDQGTPAELHLRPGGWGTAK